MLVTRGESLFMTHPVIDILFNGFSVQTLIELANSNIVKNAHKIKLLKPITKFKVPQRLANGKMGMLEGVSVFRGLLSGELGTLNIEQFLCREMVQMKVGLKFGLELRILMILVEL